MMLRFGAVVKVDPLTRRVDLVDCEDGRRIVGAMVLSGDGSTNGGSWALPSVKPPASETSAGGLNAGANSIIACYAAIPHTHRCVIIGFGVPDGHTIAFNQDDRIISYHPASGAYTTIAPDGSIEMYHPSGAYFRIGSGPHEDLSKVAPRFKTVATGKAPTISLVTPNFSYVVDPGGNVTTTAVSHTVKGKVTFTDEITAAKTITASEDVTAGGISLMKHVHGGVKGGDSTTSTPE